MTRKSRKRRNRNTSFGAFGHALDLMLAGHDTVIGSDFIMTRNDPYNAEIGHLNPEDLRNYDQKFINTLVKLNPRQKLKRPDLKKLFLKYRKQRDSLNEFQQKFAEMAMEDDIAAAKELGNYDTYIDKIVIRNDAEFNIFYDYIALYRKLNKKRAVVQWRLNAPEKITKKNNDVIVAHEKAKFAVLRLDENLKHGAILVTNIITKSKHFLIDKALNNSNLEGCFFICSILDMGEYIMTSGGGIPVRIYTDAGKSALTLLKKHLAKLRTSKRVLNNNIIGCAQEIYGFCLRAGLLKHMTTSP
jgi:hypothetical protein